RRSVSVWAKAKSPRKFQRCEVMGENIERSGHDQVVLRVDQEGRIVGMSEGARALLGHDVLGKPCDRAVRGVSLQGEAICQQGCAARLACGAGAPPPARLARIRQ